MELTWPTSLNRVCKVIHWAGIAAFLLVACEPGETAPQPETAALPGSTPTIAIPPSPAPEFARETAPAQEPEDPKPYDYAIGRLSGEVVRRSPSFHDFEVHASISNRGGSAGQHPVTVTAKVNEDEPQTISVFESSTPGSTVNLEFVVHLGPGANTIEVTVGDASETIVVTADAADLSVEILPHSTDQAGQILLPLQISNQGSAAAENIHISINWGPAQGRVGAGSQTSAQIPELAPQSSQQIELPIQIPPGEYEFEARVTSETLEADAADNKQTATLVVAYEELVLEGPGPPQIVQEEESITATIFLEIENRGQSTREGIRAGLARLEDLQSIESVQQFLNDAPGCPADSIIGCWQTSRPVDVPVGSRSTIEMELPLGPGEHELVAFILHPMPPTIRGPDQIQQLKFRIDARPAVQLNADLETRVLGYWSDSTASVEIQGTIGNSGYRALTDELEFMLACRSQTNGAELCRSQLGLNLADGFGPNRFSSVVRVPMGQSVEIELSGPEGASARAMAPVPEKILGVERFIWDCYSARKGYRDGDQSLGIQCGGWEHNQVHKWWPDSPIKVWVSGPPAYQAVFRSVLAEFAPLLNLEFEYVDSDQAAQLKAYVGVPSSDAAAIWGDPACGRFAGCGNAYVDPATGIATSGKLSAWVLDGQPAENAIGTISHEILHAIAAVSHRHTPDRLMEWPLSQSDKAILALNSHPLLRPGMTMSQARQVIVLRDELLDAPPKRAQEYVWRGAALASQAGSLSFDLSGERTGGACEYDSFGPARYWMSEIGYGVSRIARLESGEQAFWESGGFYWSLEDGGWRPTTLHESLVLTGWAHQSTDLFRLLWRTAAFGRDSTFRIIGGDETRVVVGVDSAPVPQGWLPMSDIRFTIDRGTGQIFEYSVTRPAPGSCTLRVLATNGQVGGRLELPPQIQK